MWRIAWSRRAYPRSCGEFGRVDPRGRRCEGLPPLVRGVRRFGVAVDHGNRLTPARAGSSRTVTQFDVCTTAYPRSCGEFNIYGAMWNNFAGLPPLVRGVPVGNRSTAQAGGLTPARAGSSSRWSGRRPHKRAYPRSCGEFLVEPVFDARHAGLPPLVRGVPLRRRRRHDRNGLTPARAGSSTKQTTPSTRPRAYPRSCGEFRRSALRRRALRGLPPLVRGVPPPIPLLVLIDGLTPARAGSSSRHCSASATAWAYPRSCGEFHHFTAELPFTSGLPPLVRGVRNA